MKDYQKAVDEFVQQFTVPYWSPQDIMLRLSEESGELAREVNHRWGPKKKKTTEDVGDVGDEIADIIFTLCCLANSQGIDLDECFKRKLEKCYIRDNNRYERKS